MAVRASFCPAASSASARRARTSDWSCGVSSEPKRTTRKYRAASANRPPRYIVLPVSKTTRSKAGAGVASGAGSAGVGSGVAGSCAAARPAHASHSAQRPGARREMPLVPRFHADRLRMRSRMSCSSGRTASDRSKVRTVTRAIYTFGSRAAHPRFVASAQTMAASGVPGTRGRVLRPRCAAKSAWLLRPTNSIRRKYWN